MLERPGDLVFVAGLTLYYVQVYGPHMRRFRQGRIALRWTRPVDAGLDLVTFVAWQLLPIIAIFSPRLDGFDYSLPAWTSGVGALLLATSLAWLWRAYRDLGGNWSPKLDVMERHSLATTGTYARVRHPIYAGLWLWAISQPFVVQNWIAGWSMLLAFGALYAVRVPREERMMLEAFGQDYRASVERTGRVLPRLRP